MTPASSPQRGKVAGTEVLQVPYYAALSILTEELGAFVERERVEAALMKALPEKQRERLEARR